MSQSGQVPSRDGGYHAIRGFAFQFDATILEAFSDPDRTVGVEGEQDIDIEDFYIQVKFRSACFSLSGIAAAVRQLLAQFSNDFSRRYRLYCHFQDRQAGTRLYLDRDQLDGILGDKVHSFTEEARKLFLDHFEIIFAANFETQFASVLQFLKSRHRLSTIDEAIVYHAVLNQHLTSLVLSKPAGSRLTSAARLDEAVIGAEQIIFRGGYQRHLGKSKYLTLLRSQIGNRKSVNVVFRERLVIVEVGSNMHSQDIIDFAFASSRRFYVPSNSPEPYLLLRGLPNPQGFKRELWDAGIKFTDGTNFDGDRFRLDSLTGRIPSGVGLRIVDESRLPDLIDAVNVREIYDFYLTRPLNLDFPAARSCRMAVESVADAAKVMTVGGGV